MKTTKLLLLLVTILSGVAAKAQETKTYTDAWFLLLNHYEINEKWQAGSEIHWRSTNLLKDKQQLLLRPYVNYHANKSVTYTIGYTYIRSYPYTDTAIPKAKPEHNIWEQITLKHRVNKYSLAHRYRMEHRFQGDLKADNTGSYIVDGYSFSNRFRYRFTVKRPIGEQFFIHLFDEIWVKGDDQFKQASFDRNWLYLGFGKKLFDHGNIQLAYLHQLIKPSEVLYEKHPTVQLTFQYDFKKS